MIEMLAWGFGLIEGPRPDAEGNLFFSDVTRGGVNRLAPDGSVTVAVPKRRGVGGIAMHADGGLVMSGRNICHTRDGETRVVFERPDDDFRNPLASIADEADCVRNVSERRYIGCNGGVHGFVS